MARQRMGQHFLRDLGWRKRILATLPQDNSDAWIEIGAGHGEMTELLAANGRRVVAIEGDPKLADGLREKIASSVADLASVTVVAGDVLEQELCDLTGRANASVSTGTSPTTSHRQFCTVSSTTPIRSIPFTSSFNAKSPNESSLTPAAENTDISRPSASFTPSRESPSAFRPAHLVPRPKWIRR